jgi:hypothetical protein
LYQHCINSPPECLCKLALLYNVAAYNRVKTDFIEGRIDREQRQSCAFGQQTAAPADERRTAAGLLSGARRPKGTKGHTPK